MSAEDEPILAAARAAPLAPEEDWPTPELLAEMERDLEDVRAGRAQTFTSGEIALTILQMRRRDVGDAEPVDPEEIESVRSLRERVAAECAARGLTEEGLHAAIAEKEEANLLARGARHYPGSTRGA